MTQEELARALHSARRITLAAGDAPEYKEILEVCQVLLEREPPTSCPQCKGDQVYFSKYCPCCGKKLAWGNGEQKRDFGAPQNVSGHQFARFRN
jgi:predicted amidophosphoribosyltransferase